jgi:hypothetical protein
LTKGPYKKGFVRGQTLTARCRVVDLIGHIHADTFFQDRYKLNEVNVKIKLARSKDLICLMANDRIIATELFVHKVKLSSSAFLAHAKALECGTAKCPIKRVVCKTFIIPVGFLDVAHEKIFPVNYRHVWSLE